MIIKIAQMKSQRVTRLGAVHTLCLLAFGTDSLYAGIKVTMMTVLGLFLKVPRQLGMSSATLLIGPCCSR